MQYTIRIVALTALLAVAACDKKVTPPSVPPSTSSVKDRPLAVWKPDAALLDELGPVEDVEEYQLRLPNGYSSSPQPPGIPEGVKGFAWVGPQRADGASAHIMMGLVSRPGTENVTVEYYLDEMVAGVKRRRTNWTQTPTERGHANGLTFVRTRWSGIDSQSQRNIHGFMYAAKDGSTFIHISSQDIEPHHAQTLKLTEAAALTFKRK